MDFKDIEKLMHALEKSALSRIAIREGEFELELEKQVIAPVAAAPQAVAAPAPTVISVPHAPHAAAKEEVKGRFITSPMVGTFYLTPSPDEPPFIKEGDQVDESTIVCIIEAMKVMNEVKAGLQGKIAEILVKNGEPVEFGTKIFRIM